MAAEWIGVDLDGTLAYWGEWGGPHDIGDPIWPMVDRVRRWLAEGLLVKIFTARVCGGDPEGCREYIEDWCERHIGARLEVTAEKDWRMYQFWDDRAIQVVPNTGKRADGRD